MEGRDRAHRRFYDCGIHLRYILDGEGLSQFPWEWNVTKILLWPLTNNKLFLYFFSFPDLSSFSHLTGPAAQPLLGSQGPERHTDPFFFFFTSHSELKLTSFLLFLCGQIGVLATLLTTVSGVVSVDDIWSSEWDILLVSLQVRLILSLWKATSFRLAAFKIRKFSKRFWTKVATTVLTALTEPQMILRNVSGKTKTAVTSHRSYTVCKGWVKSDVIDAFLAEALLCSPVKTVCYFCDNWAHCSSLTLPITKRVPVSGKEVLINTLCVVCWCFPRPQHLSCTLEPWQQSPPSAGWSLDMWFAGRDPVSADLCFLPTSLLWPG